MVNEVGDPSCRKASGLLLFSRSVSAGKLAGEGNDDPLSNLDGDYLSSRRLKIGGVNGRTGAICTFCHFMLNVSHPGVMNVVTVQPCGKY